MSDKVLIVQGVLNRWIVQRADNPHLAWSGSRWVEHSGGVGRGVSVSNFERIKDATEYAISFGFVVVGIEQDVV